MRGYPRSLFSRKRLQPKRRLLTSVRYAFQRKKAWDWSKGLEYLNRRFDMAKFRYGQVQESLSREHGLHKRL